MKRFLRILVLQVLLVSCADITTPATPTVEATPSAVPTSTPAPFVPTLPELIEPRVNGTADTPPEFTTGFGGEVKGISQADIDYLVAWEVYQKLYRPEQGPTTWTEQEFLEKFVPEMLAYLDKKSGVELIVQQNAGTGKLLVALVQKSGDTKSVYWDYDGEALANTNPMSLDADFSDEPGFVKLKPGLSPQFRYNALDGHWYMFAVDADGEAVEWLATNGATRENVDKRWVGVVYEPTYSYLSSSEKLGAAVQELLDNGACDVDVENPDNRMHYADGTPVPFGLIQTEKQGEVTWYYVSGVLCQGSVNVGATDSYFYDGVMPLIMVPGERGKNVVITPYIKDDSAGQTMMFVSGPISQKSMIDSVVQKNAKIYQTTFAEMGSFIASGVSSENDILTGKQIIVIFNTSSPNASGYKEHNTALQIMLDMIAGNKTGTNEVQNLFGLLTLYLPDVGVYP